MADDESSPSLPIIRVSDTDWSYGEIPGFGTIEIIDSGDDVNDVENV